ncbi:MAG: hypothetical protein ACYTHJ_03995 [Planctomycetota bacterium]
MNSLVVTTRWIALASLVLVPAGCKEKSPPQAASSGAAPTAKAAALPPALFADQAIPGAKSVAEVKSDQSLAGDVIVQGRVGGRKEPFVDGVAIFLLADSTMKSCDELHGDTCTTPWDYCCEPEESLNAKIVTVQVVGSDGKPLRVGLNGKHGIEPLARLTVAGEVANRSAGALVINASKIHVTPRGG